MHYENKMASLATNESSALLADFVYLPTAFLVTGVAFLLTTLVYRGLNFRGKYSWPPGPRGWPLIGSSPLIAPDSGQTNGNITRIGKEYHPHMFTLTLYLGKRMLILNSYESIKDALMKQSALVSDRPTGWPFTYVNENCKNIGTFCDKFTLSSKREKKYMIRNVRQFGYGTAASEPLILQEANHLVDLIKKRGDKPFDMTLPLSLCLLNVTFSMVLNTTYQEDDKEFAKILQDSLDWFMQVFKLYNVEPLLPFLHRFGFSSDLNSGKRMTDDILDFIQKHIDYHKATLDPENPRDMLDVLLIDIDQEDPNSDLRELTHEKLLWMLFNFIPDQADTAGAVFRFLILANVLHPEVQEKVFQEIQEVIGERPPSLQDKTNMPYTESVILETLRIDTPFWLLVPHFTADDVDIMGYHIQKDTTVIANIRAVHFDPELWGDPENFRPERFINENGRIHRPDYFMPFSIGRRACIGEQLARKQFFLFYITLLQKFKLKLPDGDPVPKLESIWLWVAPPDFRLQVEPRI